MQIMLGIPLMKCNKTHLHVVYKEIREVPAYRMTLSLSKPIWIAS